MLEQWLAPLSVDAFVRSNLRRTPYARPAMAVGVVPLLDWTKLGRVLASDPPPDVLVAADGRLVDVPPPRTLSAARELMHEGLGIVARNAERHDAELSALAHAFARDLPGQVQVQLYVTPAGTQTFGWHYDFEDVFIAQTAGEKDYYFRANTVTAEGHQAPADFGKVRSETSPLHASRLLPGDWLYIPSRWWHLVRSLEDALSISIGVVPSARLLAGC